ncbi:MAG TPA: 6-pyruvoyl-tetrahydropterin synthase-related protein, partial [Thermoleophilia bacterium]|nr:6-pyruvoyl-tetrahydropterin synthase-related protein [Thermoleophilia bacterium]
TGAHHYPAQYLIQELLPNFRLTGWAPGWYAGMPMLTFYFPFPFLLIAVFNWLMPYEIAFKLVTVLGVFALPATAYAMGRLWRVRRPYPTLAAVFALIFLLMESYSIYGGNILSTLAGEFGYMLSFALVFLFLGTLYRGMEKPRFNMLFVLNCLILMALALSHVVTTLVLITIVPGLLLVNPRWRSFGYLIAVAAVGFGLSAFWSIPFAANLQWTAHMAWGQLNSVKDLVPPQLIPVAVLSLFGMAYAVARKEKRLLPLAWITVITLVVFWLLPNGRLWNARVLPFFYISLHLWAAYGAAWLVRPFTVMVRDLFAARGRTARRVYVPVVAVALGAVIIITSTTAAGWIKWNYSGYEGKDAYPQYKEINDFLDTLSPGRVMVEHSQKIDEFGTPRAFEIIPYWTKLDTMEGTLMEASFTAPFHFINQAELSKEPSNAIIGVKYPARNVPQGLTHLQLMNIPYLLTVTPEVTNEVLADSRAELLATYGDYNVFRIVGATGYVEVMKNQPVRLSVSVEDWRDLAVDWYLNPDDLSTPIVLDQGEAALQQYPSIAPEQSASPPVVPITTEGRVTGEDFQNESLSFDTTAVGQPHWIKISYFPNWHVEGAEGPYLVSPSFMMVIPTQSHVTLYYGRTAANTIGQVLEILGWLLLLGLSIWRAILWRRRRRLAVTLMEPDLITGAAPHERNDQLAWPWKQED